MVGQGDSQTRFRFAPRPVRGAKRASKPPPESQCISMARVARRQPERPRRRMAVQVSSFFLADGILKAAHGFAAARIVHRKFHGGFVMRGEICVGAHQKVARPKRRATFGGEARVAEASCRKPSRSGRPSFGFFRRPSRRFPRLAGEDCWWSCRLVLSLCLLLRAAFLQLDLWCCSSWEPPKRANVNLGYFAPRGALAPYQGCPKTGRENT